MADADAKIRPYVHNVEDNRLVRFMVGKERMEPLATANIKATTHYWTIAAWIAISCTFVQFMQWWPRNEFGYWEYLRPFPAFAVSSLPLMFAIDLYQRSAFEEESVQVLERPDMVDIPEYYSRSPSSGVWIYEFGSKFVGLITVDASLDSLNDDTIIERGKRKVENTKPINKQLAKGTSSTATIRHIYVAEPYRPASAANDLIKFAVNRTFEASNTVERIRATPSPLFNYLGAALKAEGFTVTERGRKVGLFGWTTLTYELTRESWKARQ